MVPKSSYTYDVKGDVRARYAYRTEGVVALVACAAFLIGIVLTTLDRLGNPFPLAPLAAIGTVITVLMVMLAKKVLRNEAYVLTDREFIVRWTAGEARYPRSEVLRISEARDAYRILLAGGRVCTLTPSDRAAAFIKTLSQELRLPISHSS